MIRKTASENPAHPSTAAGWSGSVTCPRCKKESRLPSERCGFCGYSFLETRAVEQGTGETAENLIGRVINDKYRVISVLGEGGFGVVYKVELLLFDTSNVFALKLLHPSLSQDAKFRRRFLREAALAMQLIHENTIQIREFGRTEDDSLFYTMDYCEGESLKSVIAREGFLTVNRALDITRQILSVMELAHSRGIMHRDLKPENVFLLRQDRRRDFVKVGDFGLAKSFVGGGRNDITHRGILGTPRYMSPEQARGLEDLDHRSDLYSIGVVLYEMLYGEVHGEDTAEGPLAGEFPPPPQNTGHVVPQAVWQVVRKALARRRADRFQSAEEFANAIRELPSYTPTYLEPQPGKEKAPPSWWKRAAALVALALVAAVPLSLIGGLGPSSSSRSSLKSDEGTSAAAAESESSERGLPPEAPKLSANIGDYFPLVPGAEYTYEIIDSHGPANLEITYKVLRETEPGDFDVSVSGDRVIQWHVNQEENTFSRTFLLPDPETGKLDRPELRELLRLPADGALENDFVSGGVRVHAEPRSVEDGGWEECLLVESREGAQRRFEYYKEGVGLVAIEVYEASDTTGGPPAPEGETKAPGRLVYARYLTDYERPPESALAPEEG